MRRLVRMDGLRGVLAVYVMLGHVLPLAVVPGAVASLFSHGEAAVDLFFALSGLVIVNSLERFGQHFSPFMAARAWRLLPVYFVVLALSIWLMGWGDPLSALPWAGGTARQIVAPGLPVPLWPHVVAHLVLLQGLIPQNWLPYAYVTLLGPAWSLSTEWQFYLLVGLIAPRRLGRLALAMLGVAVLYRLLLAATALPPGLFSRAFLPDAACWFALGLASAVWLRGGGAGLFALCLAVTCLLAAAVAPAKALVPLAWAGVMLAQTRPWGRILEHPVLRYLGAISYPLYLVNEPVARAVALYLGPLARGRAVWFSMWYLPCALLLSCLAAMVLHHGVERVFTRSHKNTAARMIAPAASQ